MDWEELVDEAETATVRPSFSSCFGEMGAGMTCQLWDLIWNRCLYGCCV